MSKSFDVISIGDATLDVFLDIDEATVVCELEKEACRLCINYADKIPVRKVTKIPGVGNSANFAVGASRLGLRTAFYTVLGNDDTGKEIFKRLQIEGVAPDYIQFDKKRGSNYSVVLNFKGERTILVYHEPREYSLPRLASTRWIYFSSLAAGHEKVHQQLCEYIKKTKARLGFNPGTFQLKEGLEVLGPIMKLTTVFMVNKEEAQRLVGRLQNFKELLVALKKQGPEIVVIGDGPNGSYAFDGNSFYFQDIFKSPMVERTGAGDSYSIGFISALAYGHDICEAMRWGTVNAAFVIGKIGAQEGLLKKKELVKILAQHQNFKPKKIYPVK
ncbi:carbohydrate kinase family protein [Patescibacteria group bacterium AH-259-L07]|nr:carbohydrate kinase family protein [Patescibacteria group bacterium AH-259-L07]